MRTRTTKPAHRRGGRGVPRAVGACVLALALTVSGATGAAVAEDVPEEDAQVSVAAVEPAAGPEVEETPEPVVEDVVPETEPSTGPPQESSQRPAGDQPSSEPAQPAADEEGPSATPSSRAARSGADEGESPSASSSPAESSQDEKRGGKDDDKKDDASLSVTPPGEVWVGDRLTISGTLDAKDPRDYKVTVTIDGRTKRTEPNRSGAWSVRFDTDRWDAGTYTVQVSATKKGKTLTASTTVTVLKESLQVVASADPAESEVGTTVTISGTVSGVKTLAGVAIVVETNGGSWHTTTGPGGAWSLDIATVDWDAGPYLVDVTASQGTSDGKKGKKKGTRTASTTTQFTLTVTPPTVAIVVPAEGAEFEVGEPITVSGTVTPGTFPVDRVVLTVECDGSVVAVHHPALVGTAWSTSLTRDESGSCTFTAVAYDTKDTPSAPDSRSVQVVYVDPVVSITVPSPGTHFGAGDPVMAQGGYVEGSRPVVAVELEVSGPAGTLPVATSLGAGTWSADLGVLPPGEYTATAVAVDDRDVRSAPASTSFVVDAVGPSVAITSPAAGTVFPEGETVPVTGTADAGSFPLDHVVVTLSPVADAFGMAAPLRGALSDPVSLTVDVVDGLWSADFTGVPVGDYAITAVAVDVEGQESAPALTSVSVVASPAPPGPTPEPTPTPEPKPQPSPVPSDRGSGTGGHAGTGGATGTGGHVGTGTTGGVALATTGAASDGLLALVVGLVVAGGVALGLSRPRPRRRGLHAR